MAPLQDFYSKCSQPNSSGKNSFQMLVKAVGKVPDYKDTVGRNVIPPGGPNH